MDDSTQSLAGPGHSEGQVLGPELLQRAVQAVAANLASGVEWGAEPHQVWHVLAEKPDWRGLGDLSLTSAQGDGSGESFQGLHTFLSQLSCPDQALAVMVVHEIVSDGPGPIELLRQLGGDNPPNFGSDDDVDVRIVAGLDRAGNFYAVRTTRNDLAVEETTNDPFPQLLNGALRHHLGIASVGDDDDDATPLHRVIHEITMELGPSGPAGILLVEVVFDGDDWESNSAVTTLDNPPSLALEGTHPSASLDAAVVALTATLQPETGDPDTDLPIDFVFVAGVDRDGQCVVMLWKEDEDVPRFLSDDVNPLESETDALRTYLMALP